MRVLCPLTLAACILNGWFAWHHGLYGFACFNAFLAGVNLILTDIEWRWFKL